MATQDSQSSLYLVMDMINDLVHADGPSGKGPLGLQVTERSVVARTAAAIDRVRALGMRVGFVRVGFSADYRECAPTSRRFVAAKANGLFRLGSWGTELHPSLKPSEDDLHFVKHRVSPFYGTDLELVLRVLNIQKVYLSGVSTNGVVHSAVRDFHDRDLPCVVIEDCCAAASIEEHRHAVECMRGFADILTVAEAFP